MLVTRYPTEKPTDNTTPTAILEFYQTLDQRSYRLMHLAEQHYGETIHQACEYLKLDEGQRASERFLARVSQNGVFVVEAGFGSMFRAFQTIADIDLEGLAQMLLDSGNLWRDFVDADATLDLVRAISAQPDDDTTHVIAVVPRGKSGASKHSRYHSSIRAA